MNNLYGIDGPEFFKFLPVRDLEKNQQALAELNNGKNIITSNVLKSKLVQLGGNE
jgi:hypothetical protein